MKIVEKYFIVDNEGETELKCQVSSSTSTYSGEVDIARIEMIKMRDLEIKLEILEYRKNKAT